MTTISDETKALILADKEFMRQIIAVYFGTAETITNRRPALRSHRCRSRPGRVSGERTAHERKRIYALQSVLRSARKHRKTARHE